MGGELDGTVGRRVVDILDHDGAPGEEGGIEAWLRLGESVGLAREQLLSQELVLPTTLLAQLRPLATSVALERASGATAEMPPIWDAMASASTSLIWR